MRAVLSILPLALFAGCSSSPQPSASVAIAAPAPAAPKEKVDAFAKLYFGCVEAIIIYTDDGFTDPTSIAIGAMGHCASEREAYLDVVMEGKPLELRHMLLESWNKDRLPGITAMVLKRRAATRSKPAAPPPTKPPAGTTI